MPDVQTSTETQTQTEQTVIEGKHDDNQQFGLLHIMKNNYKGAAPVTEVTTDASVEKEIENKGEGEDSSKANSQTQVNNADDITLPKLEEMEKANIIAEYKKLQTKLSDKDNEVKSVQASSASFKKYEDFVNELKNTGVESAFQKYGTDLQLPRVDEVETYFMAKTQKKSDIGTWQKTDLLKKIEEKFQIKSDDFEYDPAEAYKADTPSYFYRVQTELKEKEFNDALIKQETDRHKLIEDSRKKVTVDLETIKSTYFKPEESELYTTKIKEFDELPKMIREGKVAIEKDPFSVLNLFRAANFDFLVQREVQKAVEATHAEYKKHGLVIRDEKKPTVTDPTTVKGGSLQQTEKPTGFSMIRKVAYKTN